MKRTYAVCVLNTGYTASLERGKMYRVVADDVAAKEGMLRVVDESGEDYLYPREFFDASARSMTRSGGREPAVLACGVRRSFAQRPDSGG